MDFPVYSPSSFGLCEIVVFIWVLVLIIHLTFDCERVSAITNHKWQWEVDVGLRVVFQSSLHRK